MVIGIDGHMLGDHSGGNESYYTNILKAMPVEPKDKIFLFVRKSVDVSEFENKYDIIRFKSVSSLKRYFIELDRLCREYGIEVLHTQYFIPFIRSCKIVCTIHDICFEHYRDIFTSREYLTQKLLIPYAARHSEYIFTVSNHARQDIIDHYKVDPDKVIVTYNAVNSRFRKLSAIELNEDDLRDKYEIGNEEYVLTVGNLQPRKNLSRLIEAFNIWRKRSEFGKLVIVGKKAWMYDDILKSAGDNPENIILTDYVSEEDLIRLYNASTCFIYPSYFEGFGIPPLEAMACGTPVAVANTTSLPEVVGEAGLYFDPFNIGEIETTIERLMTDREIRTELEIKGNKQVSKFDWEKSAKLIIQTYYLAQG